MPKLLHSDRITCFRMAFQFWNNPYTPTPDITQSNNYDKGEETDTNNCTPLDEKTNTGVTQEITESKTNDTATKTNASVTQETMETNDTTVKT